MKNIYCCFYTKNQCSSVVNYRSAQERGINPTIPPRQIDVNSMWTPLQYVEDQISTNFNDISTYFFDVISLSDKYHVLSTYFFQPNFHGRKIHIVSMYFFFLCNLYGRKISTFMHVLFSIIFQWAKIRRRFGLNFKLIKTFEKVFLC